MQATLAIAAAIIAEASLSFLGLGQQPPAPSWGSMLNTAKNYIDNAPWMAIWPGLAIFLLVLSFNLLGDGLRDALDPRQRPQMRLGPGSVFDLQGTSWQGWGGKGISSPSPSLLFVGWHRPRGECRLSEMDEGRTLKASNGGDTFSPALLRCSGHQRRPF